MVRRASFKVKLLVAGGATVMALASAEVLCRLWLPGPPQPVVICAPGGEQVPFGEQTHFLFRASQFERDVNKDIAEPHGHLQAHLHLRYRYPGARWAYFDADRCVSVDVNSLGFRDQEFTVEKQPGELRIMALGDSFTYGLGVQLQDCWVQVLERELRKTRPGPVEVINGGFACGSYSPDGYDRWMASDGIRFAPDLVIVGLCLNDLGDGDVVPMLSYPVAPRRPVLGSVLLGEIVRGLEQRRLRAEHHGDYAAAVAEHPASWLGTQRGLRELHALLAPKGVPLVVAVFPMLSELDHNYPYEGLHTMAREFCRQEGISCVDLRHVFDGHDETDLWVDYTDQHPNDVGHRLMAMAILDWLRRERLVQ
jgi:lysophospholipase L1-like esterase